MLECESKLRKWGNSFGLVVLKNKVKKLHLKPGEKVRFFIPEKKSIKIKDIFGKQKNWKKSTTTILREIRKDMRSKFD